MLRRARRGARGNEYKDLSYCRGGDTSIVRKKREKKNQGLFFFPFRRFIFAKLTTSFVPWPIYARGASRGAVFRFVPLDYDIGHDMSSTTILYSVPAPALGYEWPR